MGKHRNIDSSTRDIYEYAEPDEVNSWLRTLAHIQRLPERWPTRWARRHDASS
jgi:hypothetical protein